MHLLLLQLLVLLPLGKTGQSLDGHKSHNSFSFVLLERNRREISAGNHEETEDKPDLFVAVPHLVGTSLAREGQRQRDKMLSSLGRFWQKPEREVYPTRDVESEHFPSWNQALTQSIDEGKGERSPLRDEAKKFWHRFMLRKGPASQGVILPIKSHEVHRETCRTVPFSQTITHDDCEKIVVQNRLCFGKCGSIHFPGAPPLPDTFCSHCLPTKFTSMRLRLNCTSLAPVVKVVMQVEECQCTAKTEHGHGPVLQAGSEESFIPGAAS